MGSRQDLRVTPTSLDIHFLTKASTTQTIHCRCDCNFVLESEIFWSPPLTVFRSFSSSLELRTYVLKVDRVCNKLTTAVLKKQNKTKVTKGALTKMCEKKLQLSLLHEETQFSKIRRRRGSRAGPGSPV